MLPIAVSEPAEAQGERRHSLQTLERGMAVIQAFSRERPALTLSEVAHVTGITRASARRILLTLQELGYVRSDGRIFSPTPRLLRLGWAYLASLNLSELAMPLMQDLVDRTMESCAVGVLDVPEVVYIARVPAPRVMSVGPELGARLPAHNTSMGRVLLAGLPPEELERYLVTGSSAGMAALRFDARELRETLDEVKETGWALVDEEFEVGFRSIAAPIKRPDGRAIAAVNLSSTAARVSVGELKTRMVPQLLEIADEISTAISQQNQVQVRNLR